MRRILLLTIFLCSLIFPAFAAENEEQQITLVTPAETITLAEMNQRLNRGEGTDLYLKLADDKPHFSSDKLRARALGVIQIIRVGVFDPFRITDNGKTQIPQHIRRRGSKI